MQKKTKIAALVVGSLIIVSLYAFYEWKTTFYAIPEDYPVVIGTGTTYYIDNNNGNDANTGLTPSSAWKTVEKSNTFSFSQGDQILFIRNGSWRERIIPQSGTKSGCLYYGAYGIGEKPLFLGSISLNDSLGWSFLSNQTWKWTTALLEDVGNLIFNNETLVGVKKWSFDSLSTQGDFFYNKTTTSLFLKSSLNPALFYYAIECALGQHMVYNPHATYPHIGAHDISNVVLENLAFRYGGAYALKFQKVHHIQVLNCDINWMGGAEVDGQSQIRYGNGIEFFGLAFYSKACGNTMNQIYDSGFSFQAINSPAGAIGLQIENNTINTCGLAGYELWLRSSKGQLTNISFNNNTLSNIGYGWGGEVNQRAPNRYWGFAFFLDMTPCPTQSLTIKENIVNMTKNAIFAISADFNGFDLITIDFNHYFGATTDILFIEYQSAGGIVKIEHQFSLQQSAEYLLFTGKDQNSVFL